MPVGRREWPNAMKELRDRTAEEAFIGIRNLAPVITGELMINEADRVRREARALHSLHTICRMMENAGAPHKL